MSLTTDPNDPRIRRGSADESPVPQNEVYLVLSPEERSKGYCRPYRDSYQHVGRKPTYPLRDLSDDEMERYAKYGYVAYEEYPATESSSVVGAFWTQKELDFAKKPCNAVTTMGFALSETYAVNPKFYGSTYCVGCLKHRPIEEFVWTVDGKVVGS